MMNNIILPDVKSLNYYRDYKKVKEGLRWKRFQILYKYEVILLRYEKLLDWIIPDPLKK